MTSPPQTPARGLPLPEPATRARAADPRRAVGDYTLLTQIGEGGMGVVHLARKGEGPRVALKVLRPQVVGDQEARQRLAREVASLRRIRSRWVAEILDADPWAPVPYVATRYVPGLSLHDFVGEEGPISGPDLLWFAAGLAEGVASVHAVGVLHRDVKPSNVLMEGRTPILIDFGLARVADDPKLTHTGWLLGTPGYLAPEILYGEDATAASDVHSWAATVAFAATGRPPFGRGPSMAIMDRVRRGEHDLSGIPAPLVHLLADCLHPEPARRPTLDALLGWLRPQVAPQVRPGILAAPPSAPPPMTMPYAAAAAAVPEQVTDRLPPSSAPAHPVASPPVVPPPSGPGGTRHLPGGPAPVTRTGPPAFVPLRPPRAPLAVRARRATTLGVLALLAGAAVSAYPWLGAALLVVLTWLLRSGSRAATVIGERRRTRGSRWYDAPQLLVRAPWELLRSLPASIALVLWSIGLAVAAALLCYAFAAGETITLLVCGTVFAIAVWSGPGGARVRSPIARVVVPLARDWKVWLVVTFVLLVLSTAIAALAEARGSSWVPGQDRPLSGPASGQASRIVAPWSA